ncbi:MAG: hypothetical protein P4M09_12925 [Devosia sp.]|nr:hypothetical protein [Devosia sp.]
MSNISNETTFVGRERARFKDELVNFYSQQSYSHVLTLAWNRDAGPIPTLRRNISLPQARSDIGKLLGRIDRRLYGTDFHKSPDRTRAVFFMEKVKDNLHAHGLIHVPSDRLLSLHRLLPGERGGVWNDVVAAGSYKLEMLHDPHTTIAYIVKEQHLDADDRTIIWSDEFIAKAH